MGKLNEFLYRQIIQKDVGEETFLTWKETIMRWADVRRA